MRLTGSFALAGTAALALVLTGCAGAGDKLSYEDSPLSEYFAAAYGGDLSPEEQEKQFQERQRKQEELMAKCMAKEGFEYKPNIQDTAGLFTDGEDNVWEPDKKEWVEKYGYGIVNSPFSENDSDDSGAENADPNEEYVQSLSASEQAAYYETAYGAPPAEDEANSDGSFDYSWKDAGCQGWAQHKVDGDDPWQSDEFADLRKNMEELYTSAEDSDEQQKLNNKWVSCMEDKGEPGFKSPTEAQQSISDEQSKIFESAAPDPAAEEPVDQTKSPEMKELGKREIELALVDLECRTKTDYTEESLKIQFALEEKFIADNKADLEAFKAAAEQNK